MKIVKYIIAWVLNSYKVICTRYNNTNHKPYAKIFEEYRMLKDVDVYKKYSNIPSDMIIIIDSPSVIYNVDEGKVLTEYGSLWVIIDGMLKPKPGNIRVDVSSYLTPPDISDIKDKLLVFRHDTPHYRYFISNRKV